MSAIAKVLTSNEWVLRGKRMLERLKISDLELKHIIQR